IRARGADHDPALVAEPTQVALVEDAEVLVGDERLRGRVVRLQVRVAEEEPQHDAPVLEERSGGRGDDRVRAGRRAARENDPDATDVARSHWRLPHRAISRAPMRDKGRRLSRWSLARALALLLV